MKKRSQEDLNKAFAQRLVEIRKTHKIQVLDLRVLASLTGGRTFGLEELPKYKCTCGTPFETEEEADDHAREYTAEA